MSKGLSYVLCLLIFGSACSQSSISQFYCQGCCGFVSNHLILKNDSTFVIQYTDRPDIENQHAPINATGTYLKNGKKLTLNFLTLAEKIEVVQLGKCDSLILHISIKDTNDEWIIGSITSYEKEKFLGNKIIQAIGIDWKGETLYMPYYKEALLKFECLGFNSIKYNIDKTGEYKIDVTMMPDLGMFISPGEERRFKIVKRGKIGKLRDSKTWKIRFTTKQCSPIITSLTPRQLSFKNLATGGRSNGKLLYDSD